MAEKSVNHAELERNKSVVREIMDAFNTGDHSVIGRLLHPDVVELVAPMHGMEEEMINMPVQNRVQQEIINDNTAFPDHVFYEDDIMAEDDRVILRWTFEGTHTGPLFGRKPTGKRVKTFGYEMVQLKDGKIIAHKDDGGATLIDVLRQLGWLDAEMMGKLSLLNHHDAIR